MRKSLTAVICTGLAFSGASWGASLQNGASQSCPDLSNPLSGTVRLNPGCVYHQQVTISSSDTHLDCQGATLDGGMSIKTGILVAGQGAGISNVSVKNCIVRNFVGNGVMVVAGKNQRKRSGVPPMNIVLEGLKVENTRGVGVNFNSYVSGASLINSRVSGSVGAGIYLSQSTSANLIAGNEIVNNGRPFGRHKGREGIAIDSSARNKISNNLIQGNGRGGIFVYKNCGEHFSTGKSVIRWQHSDANEIVDNKFEGGEVGVWLASRQSRNQKNWDCGDKPVDPKGKYYNDYADHNVVTGNSFCNLKAGVIVEGDHNRVENNRFDSSVQSQFVEPYREKPKPNGSSSEGNIFSGNVSEETQCGSR